MDKNHLTYTYNITYYVIIIIIYYNNNNDISITYITLIS